MIIERLNLLGFGKFNDVDIELKDGINIIYGENEAGKTTAHNFINGMFYGFLKPYVKRTLYLDEHEKYRPWDGSRYSGNLDLEKDGIKYKIEREFTKGNERTSVFIRDTGEDITNRIYTGNNGKVLQPGLYFFGFNDVVYNNTISIKQLASVTEDSLAVEVRDKIVNLTESKDEEISVDNAVEKLDKLYKEIGTERALTSPYGRYNKRLHSLKETRVALYKENDEYKNILKESQDINSILSKKEEELQILNNDYKYALLHEKKKIYDDVVNLKTEIDSINLELEELSKYRGLSYEDYSYLLEITRDIENMNLRMAELKEDIDFLKIEIEDFIELKEDNDSIGEDYILYEELEEEKNKLEIEKISSNYNDKKNTNLQKIIISSVIVIGLSILLTFLFKNNYFLSINLILIPIIYILSKDNGENNISSKIDNRIQGIENKQIEILKKNNISKKFELKRLADIYEMEKIQKRTKYQDRETKINKIERGEDNLLSLKKNYENLIERKKNYLEKNNSVDMESFKEGLDKKKIYDNLLIKIENKNELMKNRLGDKNLESLKNEIKEFNLDNYSYRYPSQELRENIDLKKEELNDLKIEENTISENLNRAEKDVKRLLEIEEEIDILEDKINEMDINKEAIELAKSTIMELSKEIHREFAPTINKRIGNIFSNITFDKYNSIKIDDMLNISVVNPETNELIDINSLSGGTIDQLYFSMRFGIIDEVKDNNLPLLLDDCFIQYDDNRLENIMKFLIGESYNRQIILFTCQKRERDILLKLDKNINLIEL